MNDTAEIYLWDTRIGIIHTLPGRAYSSFEYDNEFLKSGIELSPIKMHYLQSSTNFQILQDLLFLECQD